MPSFKYIVCAILVAFSLPAAATDISATINSRLALEGPFKIPGKCEKQCTNTVEVCLRYHLDGPCATSVTECTKTKRVCPIVQGPLFGKDLYVSEEKQAKFGETEIVGVPRSVYSTSYVVKNCGDQPQQNSASLTLGLTEGENIQVTNGLTDVRGAQVNVNFSLPEGVGSIGGSVSRQVTVNTQETNTTTETLTWTFNKNVTIGIAPRQLMSVTMYAAKRSARIPFSLDVVVDGALSKNSEGYSRISDVLPVARRTFVVEGVYEVEFHTDVRVDYVPTTVTDKMCDGGERTSTSVSSNSFDLVESVANLPGVQALQANEAAADEKLPERTAQQLQVVGGALSLKALGNLQTAQLTPSFFGTGSHQCQSATSLGHRCEVATSMKSDCNEVYFDLSTRDCCHLTPEGGNSIGFTLNMCLPH